MRHFALLSACLVATNGLLSCKSGAPPGETDVAEPAYDGPLVELLATEPVAWIEVDLAAARGALSDLGGDAETDGPLDRAIREGETLLIAWMDGQFRRRVNIVRGPVDREVLYDELRTDRNFADGAFRLHRVGVLKLWTHPMSTWVLLAPDSGHLITGDRLTVEGVAHEWVDRQDRRSQATESTSDNPRAALSAGIRTAPNVRARLDAVARALGLDPERARISEARLSGSPAGDGLDVSVALIVEPVGESRAQTELLAQLAGVAERVTLLGRELLGVGTDGSVRVTDIALADLANGGVTVDVDLRFSDEWRVALSRLLIGGEPSTPPAEARRVRNPSVPTSGAVGDGSGAPVGSGADAMPTTPPPMDDTQPHAPAEP